MPTIEMNESDFTNDGMPLGALMKESGLEKSTSEAYRTIQGGGARVNGEVVSDKKYAVTISDFVDGELVLQKGKKKFIKIIIK